MASDPSNPNPRPGDSWAAHAKKAVDQNPDAKFAGTETNQQMAKLQQEQQVEATNDAIKESSEAAERMAEQAKESARAVAEGARETVDSVTATLGEVADYVEMAADSAAAHHGAPPSHRALEKKEELEAELRREQHRQRADEHAAREELLQPVVEFFNQGKDPDLLRAEEERRMLEEGAETL